MTKTISHSAQATAAGFVFQFERALLHLARGGYGTAVGIETGEDVVVKRGGQYQIFEEDKLSFQATGHPLADRSKNFWNTLWIWLKKMSDLNGPTESILLSLVTTRPVGQCLIRRISEARTDSQIRECVKRLRSIGKSKTPDVQRVMNKVLAFSDDEMARVVRQCSLFDGGISKLGAADDDLKRQLKEALQLPEDVCEEMACQALAGWLKDAVMECWRGGREAWITHRAFNKRKYEVIFRLRRERIRERPVHQILVSERQREEARVRKFVEHLAIISAAEDAIIEAVNNFLCFNTEYSRLLLEADVDAEDWRAFFDELTARWKPLFRKAVLNGRAQPPEVLGQNILYETTGSDFRATLGGQRTTYAYLTSGAYHRLADADAVWWHPKFKRPKRREE